MKPLATAFVLLAGIWALSAQASGGDPVIGKTKATACFACHGEDGMGTAPNYPVLAGQHPAYLAHALEQYRSGARKNPIMAGFAGQLSDDDIADLAAWFGSLEGLITPKR
jgi:cytochrome c553